jgi:uncharacterized protein
MVSAITMPVDVISEICRKYGVAELSVFGSVLRGDFTPQSDIDFLVRFQNDDYGPWMSKLTELEEELSGVLGRRVDVVSKRGVEMSRNPIRRRHILETAEVLFEGR